MIVKKIITAMVVMMGPMEFSAKTDNTIEKEATTSRLRNATPRADRNRQSVSADCRIVTESLLKTIRSPGPKIILPATREMIPSQINKKNV